MNDHAQPFLLRAEVLESTAGISVAEETREKLLRRRLKRLERTLASHAGSLLLPLPHGLLAAFASADAAVLGACDMQRCCAAIPQLPGTRVGIRIGIEVGPTAQGEAPTEHSLAGLINCGGIDDVVVSPAVVEALDPTLRQKASPMANADADVAALAFDWHNAVAPPPPIPRATPLPKREAPPPPRIILRQNGREIALPGGRRVITIGRDPANDVTVLNPRASRNHCQILIQQDSFVLVDRSTNGTYLMPETDAPHLVKRQMTALSGKGWIALGHTPLGNDDGDIEFEIHESGPRQPTEN